MFTLPEPPKGYVIITTGTLEPGDLTYMVKTKVWEESLSFFRGDPVSHFFAVARKEAK